jgi:hypothetical protein
MGMVNAMAYGQWEIARNQQGGGNQVPAGRFID